MPHFMQSASNCRCAKRRGIVPGLLACVVLLALAAPPACAQGGPPMITDDPDTPGDGRWEINLGSIGNRSVDGWLIQGLDADINYGWGERVQLKFDTSWNAAQQGSAWTNGLGNTLLGVKWRFFDSGEDGPRASIYPQLGLALNQGSTHRGLANPGRSLFLPIEASTSAGPFDIDGEIGRREGFDAHLWVDTRNSS